MERTIRVVTDGQSFTITAVEREGWDGMTDPCPECGGREFDHVSTAGGHYGPRDGAVVLRSDYWDAERPLFTRCRGCGRVLYRHAAFGLRFGPDGDEGSEDGDGAMSGEH